MWTHKTYDESGTNIDYVYKCEIKNTGLCCEKMPKECSGSNKIFYVILLAL